MSTGEEVVAALRALRAQDGPARLTRALGLEPHFGPSPDPVVALPPELERLMILAERRGVRLLHVELGNAAGLRVLVQLARQLRAADGLRGHLLIATDASAHRVVFACTGPEGELRHLSIGPDAVRPTDVETLGELVAQPDESGIALCLRWMRALDRSRVTARFFADFRSQRDRVAESWTGIPRGARAEREQLALLLLCRLMFLYFLQKDGHLAGDPAWMSRLHRRLSRAGSRAASGFRRVLQPLFFGVLNTRPERRTRDARQFGDLSYLNGGLFERTGVELRFPDLDLADAVLADVFEQLLERYRFTTSERSDEAATGLAAVGVDPEMLGRVFEGLMAPDRRGDSGTFFTPPHVVTWLVGASLTAHLARRAGVSANLAAALLGGDATTPDGGVRQRIAEAARELRILDFACGSGAFLLGALSAVGRLRAVLEGVPESRVRRELVARSLYGVDLQADAALLCALRLWLALVVSDGAAREPLQPLPNLDRQIRQGDALLDPIDLTGGAAFGSPERGASADARVRAAAVALAPLARAYVHSEPGEREALQRALKRRELELADAWIHAVDVRLAHRESELAQLAAQRDLFGEIPADAREAAAALPRVREDRAQLADVAERMRHSQSLPFFSFPVHFADGALHGFDLIITNPPWVRAHRWPAPVRRMLRQRYVVCRDSGWKSAATAAHASAGGQVDLALLFLERALRLLAEGGTLGILLPAKLMRSLYGAPARRLILRHTRIDRIDDHSLNQHSIFAADAFAMSLVATKTANEAEVDRSVQVRLHRRRGEPWCFTAAPHELPLIPGDDASPWLLAPPAARSALRRMQDRGVPLARRLRVRRGVFTGANDVLILRDVEPKLDGLATIRAEGAYLRGRRGRNDAHARSRDHEAVIEASTIRPLLRGADIGAFRFRIARHVIWIHGSNGAPAEPPPRTRRYLERHRGRLEARTGIRATAHLGQLFRVTRDALGPKVVWHDLAETLNAVAVPATWKSVLGPMPIVPLNTAYFIAVAAHAEALLLAALLNALPLRVFARTIAERAKDARFRFFAWTVGILPLPDGWRSGPHAERMTELSAEAHACGGLDEGRMQELSERVARLFGLSSSELAALAEFDTWLSGKGAA